MKNFSDFFEQPKTKKKPKKNVRLKPKNKSRNDHGPRPQAHTDKCTLFHLPPSTGHVQPSDFAFKDRSTYCTCSCK